MKNLDNKTWTCIVHVNLVSLAYVIRIPVQKQYFFIGTIVLHFVEYD